MTSTSSHSSTSAALRSFYSSNHHHHHHHQDSSPSSSSSSTDSLTQLSHSSTSHSPTHSPTHSISNIIIKQSTTTTTTILTSNDKIDSHSHPNLHSSNSNPNHKTHSKHHHPSKRLPPPPPLPLPPFHQLAYSTRFSISKFFTSFQNNQSNTNSTSTTKTILFLSLAITSTASSLLLSILATRLTHLSLATFPALEYLALTILSRAAIYFGFDKNHHHSLLTTTTTSSSTSHSLTWRQAVRYALPTAFFGLIASWSKAEVAGRVGIGVWQALEIFASPVLLTLVTSHPPLQPSAYAFILTSLLAFGVSLILLCQSSPPAALFLGLLSPTAQALSLVSLKTWLLSFPSRGPIRALATVAPFGLITITLPALAHSASRSVHGLGSLGVMPRLTVGTSTWLFMYISLRVTERFIEVISISKLRSPLSITLLGPVRNLICLLISPSIHVYVGLTTGHAALVVVYLLTFLGLWAVEPEVGQIVGIRSPVVTHDCFVQNDHSPTSLPTTASTINQNYTKEIKEREEEDEERRSWDGSSIYPEPLSRMRIRTLRLISFGPLAVLLLLRVLNQNVGDFGNNVVGLRTGARPGRAPGSIDLVFSYYNEPLDSLTSVIGYVSSVLPIAVQHPRVVVYVKDPEGDLEHILKVTGADEVVRLPNVGREGGTYLAHILRHYNASVDSSSPSPLSNRNSRVLGSPEVWGLADHTVFMQPEVTWHWIAKPRMELFDSKRTGFLSFGPYLSSVCGLDGLGNGNYERMRDIYVMFHETLCPPTGQLSSYAGQFMVSRKRILNNSMKKYEKLKEILEAPLEHWIHSEGGWFRWKGSTDEGPASNPRGPSSPFLGHALERSWPLIFGCMDPSIAEICPDEVIDKEKCQCFD